MLITSPGTHFSVCHGNDVDEDSSLTLTLIYCWKRALYIAMNFAALFIIKLLIGFCNNSYFAMATSERRQLKHKT